MEDSDLQPSEISKESNIVISHSAHRLMQEEGLTMIDIIKYIDSPPDNINERIRDNSIRLAFRTKGNNVLFAEIRENNEKGRTVYVYYIEDPREVFNINIERARKLINYDSGAAIILAVSAFEAFCADKFASTGELEKYLVEFRRISFQQLDTVKDVFRIRFSVDIASNTTYWDILRETFSTRHILVHRGGVRNDGSLVREEEARALAVRAVRAITALVESIP
jgi:hypothetical protein